MSLTTTQTADHDVDDLVRRIRDGDGTGRDGVRAAITVASLPKHVLVDYFAAALLRLAQQPDPATVPAAPDVEITATPADAYPTFAAEQVEALDRLAAAMHGTAWRIDVWTPDGVLAATPATTKENDR